MNELQARILHSCCVRPTGHKQFTEGDAVYVHTSAQVESAFAKLVELGWIEPQGVKFIATAAGVAKHAEPKFVASTRMVCNAASKAPLKQTWVIARAGAENHKQHLSLPIGGGFQ